MNSHLLAGLDMFRAERRKNVLVFSHNLVMKGQVIILRDFKIITMCARSGLLGDVPTMPFPLFCPQQNTKLALPCNQRHYHT